MKLVCYSGEVEANVGDKFIDDGVEWEIVAFPPGETTYSPSSLGGAPVVMCRPLSPPAGWWKQYMERDGFVGWCGDSIAAKMLSAEDGKPRSSRGDMLRFNTTHT